MQTLVMPLRNGAIIATLAAIPILVGFAWSAAWGEARGVSAGTFVALALAWLAGTGVVTGLSLNAVRDGQNVAWAYPCTNCKQPVYLFQFHCTRCNTAFVAPPEANAFRNALLLGVSVVYVTFTLGTFVLHF